MSMKYVVVSCSLRPASRSRVLARAAHDELARLRPEVTQFIDLCDYADLPFCDGGAAYGVQSAKDLKSKLEVASGIIIATPVYNFNISSAAKNMIELTGRDVWTDKVAGFLCAAGGRSSYMSVMGIANSLMLDFRTVIIPQFVYATGEDFGEDNTITNEEIADRTRNLVATLVHFVEALKLQD